LSQRLVHDLDKLLIASGNGARHASSIAQGLGTVQRTHGLRLTNMSGACHSDPEAGEESAQRLWRPTNTSRSRSLTRSPFAKLRVRVRDHTSRRGGLTPLLKTA